MKRVSYKIRGLVWNKTRCQTEHLFTNPARISLWFEMRPDVINKFKRPINAQIRIQIRENLLNETD